MAVDLVDQGLHVGQLLLVLQRGQPAPAHDPVKLALRPTLGGNSIENFWLEFRPEKRIEIPF